MPDSQMITEIEMVALNKETVAVYLLDDDPSILKATSRLLDSVGWKVEAFTDPFAFLEHAATHCPDLAVIDILMPEMNGLEVQTRLRRLSPSTRVIVLTAKDDPLVRRMAMDAGASAFFVKGVQSDEFLAGVKAAADSGN
jgi:FixJ family two-component response regulator